MVGGEWPTAMMEKNKISPFHVCAPQNLIHINDRDLGKIEGRRRKG